MKDIEIFAGKNFSDLLQEIHTATGIKRSRINDLILDIKAMIKEPNDAVMLAPVIAKYLEIMVSNDEHLVKIAAIVQKIMAVESKGKGGELGDLLSEDEKEKLLADALVELDDATKELEEVTTKQAGSE